MFSCCGRPNKLDHTIHNSDEKYEKLLLNAPSQRNESNTSCGIGIAFKPDGKGSLAVKRLIAGGSAESSREVQVIMLFI